MKTARIQQAFSEDLTQTPDLALANHAPERIATPAGEVTVSRAFKVDLLERPLVLVRIAQPGPRHTPSPIEFGAPRPGEAQPDVATQHAALATMADILGPATEPLSRLMNQQTTGAISQALAALGVDSPLRMDDGTVLVPSAGGRLHFDIDKQSDGTFRLDVTLTLTSVASMTKLDFVDGLQPQPSPIEFDLARSHCRLQFGLVASADGQRLAMAGPVSVDAAFVPAA